METRKLRLLGEIQEGPGRQSPTAVAVMALLLGWSMLEATAMADDQTRYVLPGLLGP